MNPNTWLSRKYEIWEGELLVYQISNREPSFVGRRLHTVFDEYIETRWRSLIQAAGQVWFQGMANVDVRGLTPQRWLDQEDLKLGFLVEGNAPMVLAKENLKKIES